jgi:serine/threonine protein phosphatase PrpC
MPDLTSYSSRDIGGRDHLEDYIIDRVVHTAGGLHLHVLVVCDGSGGGNSGERASRNTARTIIDYLEVSAETTIPTLLIRAVEKANSEVYNELRGDGTSTVSVIAVDIDDPSGEFGRMFGASVGNSPIYLIRDGRLVRLNIDHTLANEYIYSGQMSPREAERLENADYTTRIIGAAPEIQVDIGFYAERGKIFVNSQRAFNIGRRGLVLQEGDTLVAASAGLFDHGEMSADQPVCRDEELLRHALDDNVERAVESVMGYATHRRPMNNISLGIIFVPSRQRRSVTPATGLSTRQRFILTSIAIPALILIILLAIAVVYDEVETRTLRLTQNAIARIAIELSATPTATLTFTPTATITNTPTPTQPPTLVDEGQIGLVVSGVGDVQLAPMFPDEPLESGDNSGYFLFLGADLAEMPAGSNPLVGFFNRSSIIKMLSTQDIDNRDTIDIEVGVGSRLFINTGEFKNRAIRLHAENVTFEAEGVNCLTADWPAESAESNGQIVHFTCLGGDGTCGYTLPDEQPALDTPDLHLTFDVDAETLVSSEVLVANEDTFSEFSRFFDTVHSLTGIEEADACLHRYLDADGDGIAYPLDDCNFAAGSLATSGCPDEDNDGVYNNIDQCPNRIGLLEFEGCPPPTITPLPDSDGDGVDDVDDICAFVPGPVENIGCPVVE